ncbi:hypothetical protein TSUD_47430 [Trifolium subterraneum]|nr:hypothetical protein TSUD_47430 [Trifolium subterraneum]
MNRSDAELDGDAILWCVAFCGGGYRGRKSRWNRIVVRAPGERKENLEQELRKMEIWMSLLLFLMSGDELRLCLPIRFWSLGQS